MDSACDSIGNRHFDNIFYFYLNRSLIIIIIAIIIKLDVIIYIKTSREFKVLAIFFLLFFTVES